MAALVLVASTALAFSGPGLESSPGRQTLRRPAIGSLRSTCRAPRLRATVTEPEADDADADPLDRASVREAAILGRRKDGRSQVFGAWLDDEIITNIGTTTEDHFSRGIAAMRTGEYSESVRSFCDAVEESGGEGTSKGGQISVWLAQAYNAAGEYTLAVELLGRLEHTHPNRNVRKAASEIGYILRSPSLQLGEDSFVKIPDEIQRVARRGRQEPEYAKMEKPPERYSLEWYMEQGAPAEAPEEESNTEVWAAITVMTVLVTAVAATAIV